MRLEARRLCTRQVAGFNQIAPLRVFIVLFAIRAGYKTRLTLCTVEQNSASPAGLCQSAPHILISAQSLIQVDLLENTFARTSSTCFHSSKPACCSLLWAVSHSSLGTHSSLTATRYTVSNARTVKSEFLLPLSFRNPRGM